MVFAADDDVINQLNLHDGSGLNELGRDGNIFVAGVGIAGGVIMDDDDANGGMNDGWEEHITRVDEVSGDGAERDNFVVNDGVTGVEIQAAELFFAQGAHVADVGADIEGRADNIGAGVAFLFDEQAAAEFEAGDQHAGFGVLQAGCALELAHVADVAHAEAAIFCEDALGHMFNGFSTGAGVEDDGKQFRDGEGGGAFCGKFFAQLWFVFVGRGGKGR